MVGNVGNGADIRNDGFIRRYTMKMKRFGLLVLLVLISAYAVLLMSCATANSHISDGIKYFQMGYYQQAIESADKAISLKPNDSMGYFLRGRSYLNLEDYDRAKADLETAIRLEENSDDPNDDLITIAKRGLATINLPRYSEQIELNPDDHRLYTLRGEAYLDLEDYDKAISDFSSAIELKPDDIDALNGRALAFLFSGEFDQSIADCETVLQIDPDNSKANLTLLFIRLYQQRNN